VAVNEIVAAFAQAMEYTKEKYQARWLSAILVLVVTICSNCCLPSQETYYVGRRFPSERATYKDLISGYADFLQQCA
jgi:ABC-type arginine transport system permease subunit